MVLGTILHLRRASRCQLNGAAIAFEDPSASLSCEFTWAGTKLVIEDIRTPCSYVQRDPSLLVHRRQTLKLRDQTGASVDLSLVDPLPTGRARVLVLCSKH